MKNSPVLIRLALAAAIVFAAAGCNTVNTVTPAMSAATPDRVADKRVITNDTLNDIAYVVEVDRAVVSGNLMEVQVVLRNMTAGVKNVDYKFQWYDHQGIAITSPAPMTHTVSIEAGETKPITDVAPTPDAADWQLTLSEDSGRTPGPL
jgi:uncharacterized protein YcfL